MLVLANFASGNFVTQNVVAYIFRRAKIVQYIVLFMPFFISLDDAYPH